MFDIGLFELLVVGGVSLVVIGPEKLPGAIRTGALWVGRIKRTITNTRREIEEHIGADEIRRELRNEEIMASLEKLRETREQLEADIKSIAKSDVLEHQDHDEPGHTIENQTDSDHSDMHHIDHDHDAHQYDNHEYEAHAHTHDAYDESTLDHSDHKDTHTDDTKNTPNRASSKTAGSQQPTQDSLSSDEETAPNEATKPSDHTPS